MPASVTGPLARAAVSVAQLASEHAAQAEPAGLLDGTAVRGLRTAGFGRHFVPARWGGDEGPFVDYVHALLVLGRVDASLAWCAAVTANAARMAWHLPDRGQAALWGTTADVLIANALTPCGTAEPVRDGWLLTGSWPSVSGIHHSDAVLATYRRTPVLPGRFCS
jgi:alkylation response protein AidB-like acyl-CoA dehydrogenase